MVDEGKKPIKMCENKVKRDLHGCGVERRAYRDDGTHVGRFKFVY